MKFTSIFADFKFVPITTADLPLFEIWMDRPHVFPMWGPAVRQIKTMHRLMAEPWIDQFRIDCNDVPIGYLQYYDALADPSGFWKDQISGTYGMDLFIGEEMYTGRQYGRTLLAEFITQKFSDSTVSRLILDPDPENEGAIRCYTALGFQEIGLVKNQYGETLLMQLDRADWQN